MLELFVGFKVAIRKIWRRSKGWPMCYSKSNIKFGHEMIEPIASMSWRIRWSDISYVSSRHQHDEEWRNKVQVQDEHLEEVICLKLSILMVIMDMWRHFQKKRFSYRSMGEQFGSLHPARTIKKGVPSWGDQDCHHQAQAEYAQGKGMILIGFTFYRSRSGSCETGL